MRLNRRQLRKMILNELYRINEKNEYDPDEVLKDLFGDKVPNQIVIRVGEKTDKQMAKVSEHFNEEYDELPQGIKSKDIDDNEAVFIAYGRR